MRKTQDEIDVMKARLERSKETLPERSVFGDPNHKIIDYQLDVLNRKLLTNDQIYDIPLRDDAIKDEHVSAIAITLDWLNGHAPDEDVCDPDE